MKKLKLTLKGCDGQTVIKVNVSDAFAIAVQEIALRTKEESDCRCKPILLVEELE